MVLRSSASNNWGNRGIQLSCELLRQRDDLLLRLARYLLIDLEDNIQRWQVGEAVLAILANALGQHVHGHRWQVGEAIRPILPYPRRHHLDRR